jgi:hypothetical protein
MRGNTTTTNNTINTSPSKTIVLPKPDITGAQDTIYLCNFRVSVDGEWLCLKELQDLDIKENSGGGGVGVGTKDGLKTGFLQKNETLTPYGTENDENKCEQKMVEREWVNYCRCYLTICFII